MVWTWHGVDESVGTGAMDAEQVNESISLRHCLAIEGVAHQAT